MNSCRSIEFVACAPPLITFSIGTGSVTAASPPSQRYSGSPASAAAAFAAASEAPRIAFAPRRPLFGRAVEVDQRAVEAFLVGCVAPAQRLGDLAVDVADRLQDGLAAPPGAAVAQLDRLVDAGRGAGRDDRAAERAGLEPDVDLDRRVAARVDDLPSAHLSDLHVAPSPLAWS